MKARTEHPYYEILERCGQGGMGVVYRARDRRLNRIVALKFLIADESDGSSGQALQRFQREAEAIAALTHPAIATIYEAGVWDGSPFLALEFLAGGTLRSRMRKRALGMAEMVDYASQLGSGLAFAHSKGMLHRDIKPSNCMFSEHGALKLVDFGLAKSAGSEDITAPGDHVGTVAYMAPELLHGEPATIGSDLYALGAVVYEMAAGQPIYRGDTAGALMQNVLHGSPVPVEQLRPDLPPAFCTAIRKATARRPEDRFESVAEFIDALKGTAVRTSAPLDFLPTVTIRNSTRRTGISRRRWWVYAALAVLVTVTAVLVGRFFLMRGQLAGAPETLVVLPFETLGGGPADQALSAGLQETVTSVLSSAEDLRKTISVVPSSEVRRSQIHTIAEARKQFNATLAVTGSTQRSGDNLQLTLDLTDARRLRQKNSRILTIPAAETAGLQGQLADSLGALLGAGQLRRGSETAGQTTTNSTAYTLFLQGQGALENRNLDDAVGLLGKAVAADPNFALARAKLAEAYLRKNLSTKDPKWLALADEEVATAAAAGPSSEVLMVQGMIRQAMGKWQDAIRLFQQLLRAEPANVEAYRLLADTWDRAGHQKEAEESFHEALRLRPGYAGLYNSLGDFYSRHGLYSQAEQAFSTGLGLTPESPSMYYNLGANYFRMGRWADAGRAFEKSLAIKPTALAYANLGTVRFYEGNYAEAARQCEAATRLQPANPVNWGNLGDSLWQIAGERDKARAAFEKASTLATQQLSVNPNNPALRKLLALYLAKQGRSAEADAEIHRAQQQAPNDGSIAFYEARIYAVEGNADAVFASLKKSLAQGYSAKEVQQEPDFAPLRKDPRYGEILAQGKAPK